MGWPKRSELSKVSTAVKASVWAAFRRSLAAFRISAAFGSIVGGTGAVAVDFFAGAVFFFVLFGVDCAVAAATKTINARNKVQQRDLGAIMMGLPN
jgi:hypothetical protein